MNDTGTAGVIARPPLLFLAALLLSVGELFCGLSFALVKARVAHVPASFPTIATELFAVAAEFASIVANLAPIRAHFPTIVSQVMTIRANILAILF